MKKLLKNKSFVRRICAFLVIIALVGVVEVLYNLPSLRSGYQMIDLSENIVEVNNKYIIFYNNMDGIYIKQLKVEGKFPEKANYIIQLKYINDFGNIKEKNMSDQVNPYFDQFYTDIGKKVTEMTVTIPNNSDIQLTGAAISNRVEINKYRMLFFLFLFLLLYLFFFEKEWFRKIENCFAVTAFCFGILMIVYSGIGYNSWDEQMHFQNVYSIASGKNVEWSDAAMSITERRLPYCNTKMEYAMLKQKLNRQGEEAALNESKETNYLSYSSRAYIPMVLFMKAGMLLKLSFYDLFIFGKVANLLVFICAMYMTIRIAKYKKLFLAFIGMMPTTIFLAASYTYDSVVFEFITLGLVLWANEMFSKDKINERNVVASILLTVFGCLSKAVYAPVLLVMLLLPKKRFDSKRFCILIKAGMIIMMVLLMLTFILPTLTNTIAGNVSFGGDSRGGDTGSVRQLISMLHHPFSSVKLMLYNILKLDNFRNLGRADMDQVFFGNLMFLNFANIGSLGEKWCALWIPVLTMTVLYENKSENLLTDMTKFQKIWTGLMCLAATALVWMALYLSFTPVGEEYIDGVQARYYFPLLYMMVLLLKTKKWKLEVSEYRMQKTVWMTSLILLSVSVYYLLLNNRFSM